MNTTHGYLTVGSSEISAFEEDEKIFSLKPSGIIGHSPEVTGTFDFAKFDSGATPPCYNANAEAFSLEYNISRLGNLVFLSVGGYGMDALKLESPVGNRIMISGANLPVEYRPTTNMEVPIMVYSSALERPGLAWIATDGTLTIRPCTNYEWGTFITGGTQFFITGFIVNYIV